MSTGLLEMKLPIETKEFPLVSFLTPTFGRAARQPHIINECVYWFTRQRYPNKEMVILNDAPGQRLFTSVPGVKIINMHHRFDSLGEKMSYLVHMANGFICMPYEDDDISLPWRADQAVVNLWNTGYEYFRPRKWWYYQKVRDSLTLDGNGVGHNCSAYLRKSFITGYPDCTKRGGSGHDGLANAYAMNNLNVSPHHLDYDRRRNEVSYIYRWGVSDLHLSAFTAWNESTRRQTPD
jgi:hypothetical protein